MAGLFVAWVRNHSPVVCRYTAAAATAGGVILRTVWNPAIEPIGEASPAHTLPSGPVTIGEKPTTSIPEGSNELMKPSMVTMPSRWNPANHRLPSGPAVMAFTLAVTALSSPASGNTVTAPAGVIREICVLAVNRGAEGSVLRTSTNQTLPSGPAVIAVGLFSTPRGNWVMRSE